MTTEHQPTEELADLVAAAQGGDRAAFDDLVRRTYVDCYTLARRLTGNDEDARDVVQETYLRAWKGIGKFRGDARFSTWIYRITANCSSTQVQRRRRHQHETLDLTADVLEDRIAGATDDHAVSRVELQRVGAALDELPAKLRSVVVLKDVYGLSHEAIATELDISVAAAKVRLHRGRKRLRALLDDADTERNAHAV